jgi:guanylate kinase
MRTVFMRPEKLGILLIISGPSGAGKSSICADIRKGIPEMHFSVSCTTRPPRAGEKHGSDYFFISKEEFKNKIKSGDFLEYAKVHSNYYGTLKSEVLSKIKNGVDVLLDIDVQGAVKIKKSASGDKLLAKAIETVFIGPPSFSELERRLRSRATENDKLVRERLQDAKKEMKYWNKYDFLIINKQLPKTIQDTLNLIDILHKKTIRLKGSGFYE